MARRLAPATVAIPASDGGMVRHRLDVALASAEARALTGDWVVILVDVLRATSSIVRLFMCGADVVVPVVGLAESRRVACLAGHVLAGERGGRRAGGFYFDTHQPIWRERTSPGARASLPRRTGFGFYAAFPLLGRWYSAPSSTQQPSAE